MKTKRLAALIFAALLLLCACADRETVRADTSQSAAKTKTVAFIRDATEVSLDGANSDAARGVREFCESNGLRFIEYTVTDMDDSAKAEAVRSAVLQNADAVVCVGYFMSRFILDVENAYPDVSFLCIDTMAPEPELDEYLSPNVHFVVPDYADAGYLAGRVSAEYGGRYAFSAMMRNSSVLDSLSGYVQGISDGAGSAEILVSVDAGLGVNDDGELMIDVMSEELFRLGADVTTAHGAMIYPCSVSAKANAAKFISIFDDPTADKSCMLPSPVFDHASSAASCLGRLVSSGMKWGARDAGTCSEEGIAEGSVKLLSDSELFSEIKSDVDSGKIRIARAASFEEVAADGVTITYITEDQYEGS